MCTVCDFEYTAINPRTGTIDNKIKPVTVTAENRITAGIMITRNKDGPSVRGVYKYVKELT